MFKKLLTWYTLHQKKKEQKRLALLSELESLANKCCDANTQLEELLSGSQYVTFQMKRGWEEQHSVLCAMTRKYKRKKKILPRHRLTYIDEFEENYRHIDELWKDSNARFVYTEKSLYESLFDNIEGRALDEQQRECIIREETNNLVIAGAGSGKTTTIVGKVKYLLNRYNYRPSDLLVLSFTNASASEMAERIEKETGIRMDVMTFHKLGKEIIAKVEGKQPSVANEKLTQFIDQQFSELIKTPHYMDLAVSFVFSYAKQYRSIFDFQTQEEYQDYLKQTQIVSLNGETVKSYEEMVIANFLYTNKIKYQYEHLYKFSTADATHGQYKPDFYLPDYEIYIEHFGIDQHGGVPSFFSGRDGKSAKDVYNDSILWKRSLHKTKGTVLVETYSHEMSRGVLQENMEKKLKGLGVRFQPMTGEELKQHLKQESSLNLQNFNSLIETFINHMKANQHTIEILREKNSTLYSGLQLLRNNLFLSIVEPIFNEYQSRLTKRSEIDFNDMINKATEYILKGKHKSSYRYILVDEYQDISTPRYRLVKAIKDQNNTKLFCVGDDWQSIYRFAGSDINFFTGFEDYFGYAETSYIETTYRFPPSLIKLSSNFILKNPSQIRKTLTSPKEDTGQAFELVYSSRTDSNQELKKQLSTLPANSTVLLLGRYNEDITPHLDNELTKKYNHHTRKTEIGFKSRTDLQIQFMTAHGSKGLQADFVFILNNEWGKYGFPSNISDDPVLNLVLQKEEDFPYAEERRLFYVAITRAKKKVYLLIDSKKKSAFIKEIEKDYSIRDPNVTLPGHCPRCKSGRLVYKQGPYGLFRGCSNYPSCRFTRQVHRKQ